MAILYKKFELQINFFKHNVIFVINNEKGRISITMINYLFRYIFWSRHVNILYIDLS